MNAMRPNQIVEELEKERRQQEFLDKILFFVLCPSIFIGIIIAVCIGLI